MKRIVPILYILAGLALMAGTSSAGHIASGSINGSVSGTGTLHQIDAIEPLTNKLGYSGDVEKSVANAAAEIASWAVTDVSERNLYGIKTRNDSTMVNWPSDIINSAATAGKPWKLGAVTTTILPQTTGIPASS